eukprot:SAG11_NODE_23203_length_393_cov_0.880952_1_plen_47_part_01
MCERGRVFEKNVGRPNQSRVGGDSLPETRPPSIEGAGFAQAIGVDGH